ncbi:MAG: hypothetical protein QW613_04250, partial [Thermoprotei archaeon]
MGLEAARKLKEVLHTEKNLEEMKTQYQSESDELEKLTEKSNSLRSEKQELESKLSELKPALERIKPQKEMLEKRVRELTAEKSSIESRVHFLREKLSTKQRNEAELARVKSKRSALTNLENYVNKTLIPTLELIEAEKLSSARRDLLAKTKEYFALLMQDDDRSVKIDEQYSPVLQRRINGEWVDIPSPSGGERSA